MTPKRPQAVFLGDLVVTLELFMFFIGVARHDDNIFIVVFPRWHFSALLDLGVGGSHRGLVSAVVTATTDPSTVGDLEGPYKFWNRNSISNLN
jgi:hypothetical protein